MDLQLSVHVHFIVSLIHLSEPTELIYSLGARYGPAEGFHFLSGHSFRGETCPPVSAMLFDPEINYVLEPRECTLYLICVLFSCGCGAPLIKVTSLRTSLSTITKVHINLHMFLLEPARKKKNPYCAFYWQEQHVLLKAGVRLRWMCGEGAQRRMGGRKTWKTTYSKWEERNLSEKESSWGKTSMRGSYF